MISLAYNKQYLKKISDIMLVINILKRVLFQPNPLMICLCGFGQQLK